jgi:hypothetical protein
MTTYARKGAYALTLALAASLSLTTTASADAGQGAFRLSADIPVLGLNHFPDAFVETTFQFGLWGTSPLTIVGPIPLVGAGVGYQATDAIVIGGRLGFGVATVDSNTPIGDDDTTVGVFALLPYFEYLFGAGTIRPFIGAQAGFQVFFPDDGDANAWFIGGPLGGVHIFAADGFSISPTAFFDFIYRGADENAGFDLILAVSFEGWIN